MGALTAWLALIPTGCTQVDRPGEQSASLPLSSSLLELAYLQGDRQSASIWVVEFSDFGCIHCAAFHRDSHPVLAARFIDTGKVVWGYIPVALSDVLNGELAAMAAECASLQGNFPRMRSALYEARDLWTASETPVGTMIEVAAGLGLDRAAFESCLKRPEDAMRRVNEATTLAREAGIRGTPTFVIQGLVIEGLLPTESLAGILDALLTPGADSAFESF